MWTKEHRKRQAAFERRRYPSDLTDAEWERIKPFLPKPARCGRKPKVDLREILNAIRYLVSGARELQLAHAADPLRAVADSVLVVPALCAPSAVSHSARCGADA